MEKWQRSQEKIYRIYHGRKSRRITRVRYGATLKIRSLTDTQFQHPTVFSTVLLFRLRMALQAYSVVTALVSAWTSTLDSARTQFTGRSTMSQLPLQERIRKSYRDSTVMTQEYVSSRIVITLPGVTAIMVRQSVLHIHLILRLSYSLKMHFYHTIEMVCFSQERSTESMRCCPVQAIQDIHRLAIFSTARARILNTGVIIVL